MNSSSILFQDLETDSQYGLTADSVFIAWFIMIYFPDSWIFRRLFASAASDSMWRILAPVNRPSQVASRRRWKDCAADGGSYTRKGGIAWDLGVEKNSSHILRRLILDTHIAKAPHLIHRTPLLLRDSSLDGKARKKINILICTYQNP